MEIFRKFISNLCKNFRLKDLAKAVMNEGLSVEWVRPMFGGPFFEGREKILVSGEALKFGAIFQKFALKLLNICKFKEKISENANFPKENFMFCARCRKNKKYYIHML